MFNQQTMLDQWIHYKLRSGYYRLKQACLQEYLFKVNLDAGNFAFVRFSCEPNNELRLNWREEWPSDLDHQYVEQLHTAICSGVLDASFSSNINPYLGCSLTLTTIKWSDAGSSEGTFYTAAKFAMRDLITTQAWDFVNRKTAQITTKLDLPT